MCSTAWRRLRLAVAFAHAALRYWLTVFPLVRRETRRWAKCAEAIPDPVLRRIAIETQRDERGNYEGAGAFATFVPLRRRAAVVRAVVAFQLAYDFADSLSEQPAADPVANCLSLHESLHAALSPGGPHARYYLHHGRRDDGGYLAALVDGCRQAVARLPSWEVVACPARAMARLLAEFQAGNHVDRLLVASHLTAFALRVPRRGEVLRWWEAAAGGASSLGVFALIAASARSHLTAHEAAAIDRAYLPWIGALHVLLDSLVDWPHDAPAGHHSLVAHYASRSEMASGMGAIADEAVRGARRLPGARQHELLLVAMAGLYLAQPTAALPHAQETTARVLNALGELAWPVLLVHRARRQPGLAANRN
ncbi:MAG TPA: DUF2600 family protein [Conexibacter sp.]|nr:DUF2600 family protein [Conexibacter sp.]